jgi:hypothetical protein
MEDTDLNITHISVNIRLNLFIRISNRNIELSIFSYICLLNVNQIFVLFHTRLIRKASHGIYGISDVRTVLFIIFVERYF